MNEVGYGFTYDQYGACEQILVARRGLELLNNNFVNRGTAFTAGERQDFGLGGYLPPAVRTIEVQRDDVLARLAKKETDLDRFVSIRSLFDRNVTLAHAVIGSDIESFMPVIYTPTVGLACRHYSSMFRRSGGLYFHPGNIDRAVAILRSFRHRDIRVAVVTDNQGVLGIGDQGVGGIAISLGKLMLYTQGAGIAPWHCLPVTLDVGTDNEELLADPSYLGLRHHRLKGEEYLAFIGKFAGAFREVFPHALCQWEDFSRDRAFAVRNSYLHELVSFNDDIQGTGAVALAGIFAAMRIRKVALVEQRFVVYGAGAGGVGICEQIARALEGEGLSSLLARERIFLFDSRGLVCEERELPDYKKPFASPGRYVPASNPGDLAGIIAKTGATVLIGASGQRGAFDRAVIRAMLDNCPRPLIMPLSNPGDRAEATPAEIMAMSQGAALVATGSPFGPVNGVRVGQGNNVFIFPGVGLGVIGSGAREVLPEFFTVSARILAEFVSESDLEKGILYPPVGELSRISLAVSIAVGEEAIRRKVAGTCPFSVMDHERDPGRLEEIIDRMRWSPRYLPLIQMAGC